MNSRIAEAEAWARVNSGEPGALTAQALALHFGQEVRRYRVWPAVAGSNYDAGGGVLRCECEDARCGCCGGGAGCELVARVDCPTPFGAFKLCPECVSDGHMGCDPEDGRSEPGGWR